MADPKEPNSKSALGLGGSTTGAVLVDITAAISNMRQSLNLAVQEVRNLNQALQTTKSIVSGLQLPGQAAGQATSQNQVAPNPKFSPPTTQAGGQGGQGGGGQGGNVVAPGGGGGFRQFISGARENPILTGMGILGAVSGALPSAAQGVETQLLLQRAAFINSTPGGNVRAQRNGIADPTGAFRGSVDYERMKAVTMDLARSGTITNAEDPLRAIVALQSLGIMGPNITQAGGRYNSVVSGIGAVSNLIPGLGVEGTARAFASMQAPQNVNMLRGIGIKLRGPDGQMKGPDQIIDDFYAHIDRDIKRNYGVSLTEDEMKISLQPGNSLGVMLDTYFGNDPVARSLVEQGLIYKAKTGGKKITKQVLKEIGGTTEAMLDFSKKQATATEGLVQTAGASARGYSIAAKGLIVLGETANMIDRGTGFLQTSSLLNSLLGTISGAGGGLPGKLGELFAALAPKAEGGPVGTKTPYLVGERGPELFIPNTDGAIIPNKKGGLFREGGGDTSSKGTGLSETEWARELIKRLGGSPNEINVDAVKTWMRLEGGHYKNSARYNPLNTTYDFGGTPRMGDGPGYGGYEAGVKTYENWEQGFDATIKTLTGSKSAERGYDAIIAAIKDGKSKEDILNAVYASRWGTGAGGSKGSSTSSTSSTTSNMSTSSPINFSQFSQPMIGWGATANPSTMSNIGSKTVTININGATDPKAVAKQVKQILGDEGYLEKATSK